MIKNKVRVSFDNVLFFFYRCWVSCFMLFEFMFILSKLVIVLDIFFYMEESSIIILFLILKKFEFLYKYFGFGLFEF